MHFELVGVAPVSESGKYFENDVWWWPRLWDFVAYLNGDTLTREQHLGVNLQRYVRINNQVSQILAKRLFQAAEDRNRYLDFIDKYMGLCEYALMVRFKAEGRPYYSPTEPIKWFFLFSWENMNNFAIFCRDSGGFVICSYLY